MKDVKGLSDYQIKIWKDVRFEQSFLGFSYDTGRIDKKTYNDMINRIYSSCNVYIPGSYYIDDILANIDFISKMYEETLELFNNYEYGNCYIESYSNRNIGNYLFEFFKYMKCHKLYEKLYSKDMVAFTDKIKSVEGLGYCAESGRLSYIAVKGIDNILTSFMALAHEMGHAYVNYVLARDPRYLCIASLKDEIFSILFEKIFLDFIFQNCNVSKTVIKKQLVCCELSYIDHIGECYGAVDAIKNSFGNCKYDDMTIAYTENGKRNRVNTQLNTHAIGNILSAKLLSENESDHQYFVKHLNDIIKEIDQMSIEDVLHQYKDLGSLENRLDRILIKK